MILIEYHGPFYILGKNTVLAEACICVLLWNNKF